LCLGASALSVDNEILGRKREEMGNKVPKVKREGET